MKVRKYQLDYKYQVLVSRSGGRYLRAYHRPETLYSPTCEVPYIRWYASINQARRYE